MHETAASDAAVAELDAALAAAQSAAVIEAESAAEPGKMAEKAMAEATKRVAAKKAKKQRQKAQKQQAQQKEQQASTLTTGRQSIRPQQEASADGNHQRSDFKEHGEPAQMDSSPVHSPAAGTAPITHSYGNQPPASTMAANVLPQKPVSTAATCEKPEAALKSASVKQVSQASCLQPETPEAVTRNALLHT